jgi:hypothetical protein
MEHIEVLSVWHGDTVIICERSELNRGEGEARDQRGGGEGLLGESTRAARREPGAGGTKCECFSFKPLWLNSKCEEVNRP